MQNPKELEELAKTLGGMPVWGALADSPAARAGIRYGDIVLRVNGMETPGVVEFVNARGLRKDGVEVELFRAGSVLKFELLFEERSASIQDIAHEIAEKQLVPTVAAEPRAVGRS
ncbi:MAG: PDZ domain-containing protein [Myxococcota bacterium]